jgi:hypothetical protein
MITGVVAAFRKTIIRLAVRVALRGKSRKSKL